jgi:hypothetical protein
MVDFGGTARPKFAGSGTLTVIEIHLSQDAPQETIQELKALVVGPPGNGGAHVVQPIEGATLRIQVRGVAITSGDIRPRLLVRLTPVDATTSKPSLIASLALLLVVFQITYYVSGTADHVIQFLDHYRDYFQTKIDGFVVPIDQAKETIKNAERSQPTQKNEHHEKSGNPSAISSEGD